MSSWFGEILRKSIFVGKTFFEKKSFPHPFPKNFIPDELTEYVRIF